MLHDDVEIDTGFAATIDGLVPDHAAVPLQADRIMIDMPLEFYVRGNAMTGWRIESSAPSQRVRTSILPVFHRIRLLLQVEPAEDDSVDGN